MVHAAPLRVVFFGTPQFAVPTLDRLLASRHPVVGVVTQPDRPRGRGQKVTDAPVKARALEAGVPVLQPPTLKDPTVVAMLAALGADIGVVAAYGLILTSAILAVPRRGMVNVHASLLPRYRGAAPINRAVIAGDTETGVTIMRVVKALDAGPILATVRQPIDDTETSEDVERALSYLGAGLLVSTLDRLAEGEVTEAPQDEAASSYAHRLTKDDGRVEWSRPATDIHNLIRGLHPWPHAYTFLHGRRIILLRSAPSQELAPVSPGVITRTEGGALHVAASPGTVDVLRLQAEGKRAMSPKEFLAGQWIEAGDRFTPYP